MKLNEYEEKLIRDTLEIYEKTDNFDIKKNLAMNTMFELKKIIKRNDKENNND